MDEGALRNTGMQVQFPPVILYLPFAKVEQQISQCLIGAYPGRGPHHAFLGKFNRLRHPVLQDQTLYLRKSAQCFRIIVVDRRTGPQALFVQLYPFPDRIAKYHRAQSSVTNGQRFIPVARRLPVPELEPIGGQLG